MAEEAKLNFYKVHRCGYHIRGEPRSKFGDIASLLGDIEDWAFNGVTALRDTCTYEVQDGDNQLHTYCFDMTNNAAGDYLFVSWNETETLEGSFASVKGSDPAGEAHVERNDVPEEHIPGYPTYFWFLPAHNLFATIRFTQRLNGHSGLKILFNEFLAKCGRFVVHSNTGDENEIKVLGYGEDGEEVLESVAPYFWSSPAKIPGRRDFIRENVGRIRKVIRKSELDCSQDQSRGIAERLFTMFGTDREPNPASKIRVNASIAFSPSRDELNEMIDTFDEEEGSSWQDVGFELQGDPDTWWLSKTLIKSSIDIDVRRDDNGVVLPQDLLQELTRNKERLLATW
jgi:hypothetical protein